VNRQRLIEMAFLLPWVGAFLLTPPVVLILQAWSRSTGFPLFIIYIFVCWLLLIVLGGILSRKLARLEDASAAEDEMMVRPKETD
jgi:uncharacterized membrane protein YraQ (UPF0718 family)